MINLTPCSFLIMLSNYGGVYKMFLTKECDYGVRIIRALADGTKKTVENIANEEQIPQKYAYKIVKKLERGDLVQSIRGRSGGYLLAKTLDSFTLLDVIAAVDSTRYVNECLQPAYECIFRDHPERPCYVHFELVRIQSHLGDELSSKSMAEVLRVDPAFEQRSSP